MASLAPKPRAVETAEAKARAIALALRIKNGETYEAIGADHDPPISKQMVKKIVKRAEERGWVKIARPPIQARSHAEIVAEARDRNERNNLCRDCGKHPPTISEVTQKQSKLCRFCLSRSTKRSTGYRQVSAGLVGSADDKRHKWQSHAIIFDGKKGWRVEPSVSETRSHYSTARYAHLAVSRYHTHHLEDEKPPCPKSHFEFTRREDAA